MTGYSIVATYLYKVSNIDGKSTGSTLIFTPSGNGFRPTSTMIYVTNSSGVVTPPTITIGTNSASFNNILPSQLLLSSTTTNILTIPISGVIQSIASQEQVFFNITVGAVATIYTMNVYVTGFYDPTV